MLLIKLGTGCSTWWTKVFSQRYTQEIWVGSPTTWQTPMCTVSWGRQAVSVLTTLAICNQYYPWLRTHLPIESFVTHTAMITWNRTLVTKIWNIIFVLVCFMVCFNVELLWDVVQIVRLRFLVSGDGTRQ